MFFFFNDTATTEIYTLSLHDALPIFLIGPDEGTHLPVLDIVHKVTADASGGSLKIEEWGLPAGEMIPPHTHAREDECSFVLEGEMKCYVGGEVVLAQKGSYVIKPRGVRSEERRVG